MTKVYLGRGYTIRARLLKSGVPYDITGASISLRMSAPSGAVLTKQLTVVDGTGGISTCTITGTENNEAGPWRSQIDGTDGVGNNIPTDVTEIFVIPLL